MRSARCAVAVFLAVAAGACAVAPDQRHVVDGVVLLAPPPVREESIGVAPVPGYIWLNGYWAWRGGRYVWIDGHWAPPRPGRHWVAHQWVRQGDGWRLRAGHWERG